MGDEMPRTNESPSTHEKKRQPGVTYRTTYNDDGSVAKVEKYREAEEPKKEAESADARKPVTEGVRKRLESVRQHLAKAARRESDEEIIARNKKRLAVLKSKEEVAESRANIAKHQAAEQKSRNVRSKEPELFNFSTSGFENLYGRPGNIAAPREKGATIDQLFGYDKRRPTVTEYGARNNPIDELYGIGRQGPASARKARGNVENGNGRDPVWDYYS